MDPSLEPDEAHEIAHEAYVYAYPLVLMHVTREVTTNVESPRETSAPVNQLGHARTPPDDTFTDIVRPNVDTLYTALAYDVSAEPLLVSVPELGSRYCVLQLLDFWTDVFAAPGARTTGGAAQRFAIVGPGWRGTLPEGVRAYRSPTSWGSMIGRIQTNGAADLPAVRRLQDAMSAVPLSALGADYRPPPGVVDPARDTRAPSAQVAQMDADTFFARFAEISAHNAPHAHDYPILDRMERVGLVPGKPFSVDAAPAVVRDALRAAPSRALPRIESTFTRAGRMVDGWSIGTSAMGTYGTDYLRRAGVAYAGLGANLPEDAVYPLALTDAAGEPFRAERRYVLRFAAGELPPVRAFWSVTLYDERQLFAANEIRRYALGDRDPLVRGADGSLEIYLQRDAPRGEHVANWLPTPERGTFTLLLRAYWPKPSVLDGTWTPPPVRRVVTGREASPGAVRAS